MRTLRTLHTTASGRESAVWLATELIERSKWFEMTPLPDNQWEFVVKDENGLPDLAWYTQRGQQKVPGK